MRSVHDRIAYFRAHPPAAAGLCLRHTWQATDIPAVGMADANAGVELVKRAGYLHADRNPPRGAWVWWTSPTHGHVCLSLGGDRILSTDVNGPATTGTVDLSFPETQWGHTYAGWSNWYGEAFTTARTRRRWLRRLLDRLTRRDKRIHKRIRRAKHRLKG